jgi:hypothetical protein
MHKITITLINLTQKVIILVKIFTNNQNTNPKVPPRLQQIRFKNRTQYPLITIVSAQLPKIIILNLIFYPITIRRKLLEDSRRRRLLQSRNQIKSRIS